MGAAAISDVWNNRVVEQASQWGPRHYRVAYGILRHDMDAQDICQKAYIKALGAQAQVDDPDRLGGWLTRVIINESLSLCRQRQRERALHQKHEVAATHEADTQASALEQLEHREQLMTLLNRLDEPVRYVVVLRTLEGMTGKQVQQTLGCSASLVSRRLHQGLDQLREWMTQEQHTELTTR